MTNTKGPTPVRELIARFRALSIATHYKTCPVGDWVGCKQESCFMDKAAIAAVEASEQGEDRRTTPDQHNISAFGRRHSERRQEQPTPAPSGTTYIFKGKHYDCSVSDWQHHPDGPCVYCTEQPPAKVEVPITESERRLNEARLVVAGYHANQTTPPAASTQAEVPKLRLTKERLDNPSGSVIQLYGDLFADWFTWQAMYDALHAENAALRGDGK